MIYRRLGTSGLKVSALSYGSWLTFANQLDLEGSLALMKRAFDLGINFFDNAEVYAHGRSEELMGEVMARLGWRRDSFIVSSKAYWGQDPADPKPTQIGLSRKHLFEACHAALRRLRLDYLDLFYCHRPDPETPVLETVRAMSDLVTQGKVLYWGTSEWPAARILEAFEVAREWRLVPPVMEQPQYNLLVRRRFEEEYAPVFERHGMGATTWSPLSSGLLTGKYNGGLPEGSRLTQAGNEWLRGLVDGSGAHGVPGEALGAVCAFCDYARSIDFTPARLALLWCVRHPRVSSVILGASRVDQLEENVGALQHLGRLTPEVLATLDKIFPIEKSGATPPA